MQSAKCKVQTARWKVQGGLNGGRQVLGPLWCLPLTLSRSHSFPSPQQKSQLVPRNAQTGTTSRTPLVISVHLCSSSRPTHNSTPTATSAIITHTHCDDTCHQSPLPALPCADFHQSTPLHLSLIQVQVVIHFQLCPSSLRCLLAAAPKTRRHHPRSTILTIVTIEPPPSVLLTPSLTLCSVPPPEFLNPSKS